MLILYFLPSKGNQIVIPAYFARNVDDTLVSSVFVVVVVVVVVIVVVGAVLFLTCHHTIKILTFCAVASRLVNRVKRQPLTSYVVK